MTRANLERELAAWDGKSAAAIEAIHDRFTERRGFVAAAVDLARRTEFEVGATWLLKRHLERGGRLTPAQTDGLLEHLDAFEAWEAQLHLLQSLGGLRIREAHVPMVERVARRGLTSRRPFVRAWSYSAFCELAEQYPRFVEDAERLLAQAAEDPAASVRARARQIEKVRAKRRGR